MNSMVGRIYRKRTNIRESYEFSVRYGRNTRQLFRFYDYEQAVLRHDRLTLIEEKAQAVFASLKAQSEYSEMEPDVKILAEQIGGIWTPDKIYNHFKTLFRLSGSEGLEWFLYIIMCRLALHRDIQEGKPPVIRKLEEQFAYLEERLEQEGRWLELAFVQVARDTGSRMRELDCLEWEDVQYPRIMLRFCGKVERPVTFGIIREKTYVTLQKLEHTSSKVFDNQGRRLRDIIFRTPGISFRFLDYRHCYLLNEMWLGLINPVDPDSGGSVYAGND